MVFTVVGGVSMVVGGVRVDGWLVVVVEWVTDLDLFLSVRVIY